MRAPPKRGVGPQGSPREFGRWWNWHCQQGRLERTPTLAPEEKTKKGDRKGHVPRRTRAPRRRTWERSPQPRPAWRRHRGVPRWEQPTRFIRHMQLHELREDPVQRRPSQQQHAGLLPAACCEIGGQAHPTPQKWAQQQHVSVSHQKEGRDGSICRMDPNTKGRRSGGGR